jgi:hypothetical protein
MITNEVTRLDEQVKEIEASGLDFRSSYSVIAS